MRVKEYRIKNNLTQGEVAIRLGISQSAYNHKENGNRSFTVEELLALEFILDTTINELYRDKKEEIQNKLNGG